jgi:hypothetical protein
MEFSPDRHTNSMQARNKQRMDEKVPDRRGSTRFSFRDLAVRRRMNLLSLKVLLSRRYPRCVRRRELALHCVDHLYSLFRTEALHGFV